MLLGRRTLIQQQDEDSLIALVRQIYGENSGHAGAANAARAWKDTTEFALDLLEAAGVPVSRKVDWRLPQQFSRAKLGRMTKDGFRSAMLARWNDGRLNIDYWDGQPVTAERAVEIPKPEESLVPRPASK